jgi:CheY-like chemotaxis protein
MGEPVRLQQIVWNLLSNAIKFTEAGGRVSVTTERVEKEALVRVEDTGIGIAPDFLPFVFDRFRQADGTRTRRHGGLGLGLAIVAALARLHKGRVEAESEGTGRGSRFTFALPLVQEANYTDEREAQATSLEASQQVLIVEDSPDTLSLLCTLFEQKGCDVTPAASAEEALRLASEMQPSVIISDIGMPGMDGYEFLTKLRRLPGMENVPAIAISGYAMDEDRENAANAGFTAHMAKPVDVDELFTLIQKLTSETC